MKRHPDIVDVLREFVGRPFVLAVEGGEVECMDGVAIEGGVIFLDDSVMTVDSH